MPQLTLLAASIKQFCGQSDGDDVGVVGASAEIVGSGAGELDGGAVTGVGGGIVEGGVSVSGWAGRKRI